jgi:putative hydrolase of the HAD superfamily
VCLVCKYVDDKLYPRSSGLLEEVTKNIQGIYNAYTFTPSLINYSIYSKSPLHIHPCPEYMIQKLGIEETEASQMNGVLYKSYGTSMAALKVYMALLSLKRRMKSS